MSRRSTNIEQRPEDEKSERPEEVNENISAHRHHHIRAYQTWEVHHKQYFISL